MNTILTGAGTVTARLHSSLQAIPISLYFLGFMNYLSLSSMYVLLNFPLPEHIYQQLSLTYQQISVSLLELVGFEVILNPLSDEMVKSNRGIHFGVKSDLLNSQTAAFMILAANVILIFFVQWALSALKKNKLEKLWKNESFHMISGHIINIIMPLVLPWTFIMLDACVRNFRTKLNAACYILLYFLGLFYPIYYFFELLQER